MKTSYYLFVMTNMPITNIYIEVTNNVLNRVLEIKKDVTNQGWSSLKKLIYVEYFQYKKAATDREKELKKFDRKQIIALVKKKNPYMIDILDQVMED